MKKKLSVCITVILIVVTGLFLFAGCGSAAGQNLEDYMKGQPNLRQSVDAQLNLLSPDAKASVQYTEDNVADVTVQYYAMTDEEIAAIEPNKAEIRCKAILKPIMEQFAEETGNEGEIIVTVEAVMVSENEMKLIATVHGAEEETEFTFQWQVSVDEGESYSDIEDATENEILILLTEEDFGNLWRVRVQTV